MYNIKTAKAIAIGVVVIMTAIINLFITMNIDDFILHVGRGSTVVLYIYMNALGIGGILSIIFLVKNYNKKK